MTTPEHEIPVETAVAARLRTIEEQPLAERADHYVQLHDELRDRLERGDAAGTQA